MNKEDVRNVIRHNIFINEQLDTERIIIADNTGMLGLCANIDYDREKIRFVIDPDSDVVEFFTLEFTRGSGQFRRVDNIIFKNKKNRITATKDEIRFAPRDVREAVYKFLEHADELGYVVH